MDEEIRLQKYLSECGVCSRRAAEEWIRAGKVTVNGAPAQIGQKIVPVRDEVRAEGRPVRPSRQDEPRLYLLFNKPRGVLTTMQDERGRDCVRDYLADVPVRVFPVGRLDRQSEGALLLTNDGEFANRMMHPRHEIPKYYEVRVENTPDEAMLERLNASMTIDGYEIRPVRTEICRSVGEDAVLRMELYEGRNRQIRKMCEQCGIRIKRLRRVAIGGVTLDGLPVGKWRELTKKEKHLLKIE